MQIKFWQVIALLLKTMFRDPVFALLTKQAMFATEKIKKCCKKIANITLLDGART